MRPRTIGVRPFGRAHPTSIPVRRPRKRRARPCVSGLSRETTFPARGSDRPDGPSPRLQTPSFPRPLSGCPPRPIVCCGHIFGRGGGDDPPATARCARAGLHVTRRETCGRGRPTCDPRQHLASGARPTLARRPTHKKYKGVLAAAAATENAARSGGVVARHPSPPPRLARAPPLRVPLPQTPPPATAVGHVQQSIGV